MEDVRTRTQEEVDARESFRIEMARITKQLADYAADPHMNDDLPPHLVGRR